MPPRPHHTFTLSISGSQCSYLRKYGVEDATFALLDINGFVAILWLNWLAGLERWPDKLQLFCDFLKFD
jgi:hypothetical protein